MSIPLDDVEQQVATPAAPARNILMILWQRKSLVLLGVVVGAVIGALLYSQQTAVYQTSAQVLVVKRHEDVVPVQGGDPRMSFYEDYVSTHLVLIRSPLIVERAVKKGDLGRLRSFQNGNAASGIGAGLSVIRDTKDSAPNNVIILSFRGPVAEECGIILDAVIDSYRDFLDEAYHNVSENTLELITRARDLLEKDLRDLEKGYREFRENSPLLLKGKDGASIHTVRLTDYETKRAALLTRAAEIEERLTAIEAARKDGRDLSVLLGALTAEEKEKVQGLERAKVEQLYPLEAQEQSLLQNYGDDHPEVQAVRRKIKMTHEFFERMAEAQKRDLQPAEGGKKLDPVELQVRSLKAELSLLNLSKQSLDRLLDEEKKVAKSISSYEIREEGFQKDIDRTQQIYEQTIKRLQEIKLVREGGGFDARAIAPPGIGGKVAPSLWQFTAAALVLGMLGGCGLAYLADLMDKSFRTPEEIRRRLGLPIVGHIPYLDKAGESTVVTGPDGKEWALNGSLVAAYDPRSPQAEAYRAVRTSLYFSTDGAPHRLIQVTSPTMGDGKSTLAANLAVTIAQSGKRVILLDADFRRPNIHKLFGLSGRTGLASVMAGELDVNAVLRATSVANLSVVPCGARPFNPAELLTSPRFAELLEEFRQRADYVIIDTPPLLAVSDPCAVAARVDGVLLTIRLSKNGRPPAERARDVLASLKVKVFGVVVNTCDMREVPKGYGQEQYGYGHGYGYGYEYTADDDEDAIDVSPETPPHSQPVSHNGRGEQDDSQAISHNGRAEVK